MNFNPKALIVAALAALTARADKTKKPMPNYSLRRLLRREKFKLGLRAKNHRVLFVTEGNQLHNRRHASASTANPS